VPPERPHSELTTVADDLVVVHDGDQVHRFEGLEPGRAYELAGHQVTTLERPGAERLCTIATVNDVHFGETVCGIITGDPSEITFTSEPGDAPYPETMNGAAVAEIAGTEPDAVIAKGDLTAEGTEAEYQRFLEVYGGAFGERLHHVRGNHESYHRTELGAFPTQEVVLPGVIAAIIDTSLPGSAFGGVSDEQLEWLDELGGRADRPVLVFGHHYPWAPGSKTRPARYFGINPDDSERLVDVVARRPRLVGYFAGHNHRNRVRHFAATGDVPWVEVASVKEFPGSWAEYRVFERGILQVHHRVSSPEALSWSNRTRGMLDGTYTAYAFGALHERCFAIPT
jgi:3',5'-cyclic-AMP phosphodiesterase